MKNFFVTTIFALALNSCFCQIRGMHDSTKVVTTDDQQASYIGGAAAMNDFVKANLHVDVSSEIKNGKFIKNVTLTIDSTGKITHVIIHENSSQVINEALTKVFYSMSKWKSSYLNGKASTSVVEVQVEIDYNSPAKNTVKADGFPQYSHFEVFASLGYAIPYGSFANAFNPKNGTDYDIMQNNLNGNDGFGASKGLMGQLGATFFFDKHYKQTAFGLRCVAISVANFPFSWATGKDEYIFDDASYTPLNLISTRMGLNIRTHLKKQFALDFYLTPGIAWGRKASFSYRGHYEQDSLSIGDQSHFDLGKGSGLIAEFGTCISYKLIKIEGGILFGKIKYANAVFSRQFDIITISDQYYVAYYYKKFSASVPTKFYYVSINFRIGN